MSPTPSAARHLAVIEAGARALNDGLTILASAFDEDDEGNVPDARAAVQRCVFHAYEMLQYAQRNGARAGAGTLARTTEEQ
jgi:hypothetical protein